MVEFHKVESGNTLWGIAKKYGTTVKELVKLNPELKGRENLIHAGDKIKLPNTNGIGTTVERTEAKPTDEQTARANRNAHQKEIEQINAAKRSAQNQNVLPEIVITSNKPKRDATPTIPQPTDNQSIVANIIKNDNSAFKIDIDKMSKRIVAAADTVGIKPDSLAAIVKNESHFSPTIINSSNGKGPTGITSIAAKDMFVRPQVYDSKMNALIKKYGSLSNLFQAKDKDPTLDLGDFGQMLYKYKSADRLYSAVQKDFDLNLRVGGYLFKYNLNRANGNEKIAFRNYNGHPKHKTKYANNAMKTLQSVRNNNVNSTT